MVKICPEIINFLFFAQKKSAQILEKFTQKTKIAQSPGPTNAANEGLRSIHLKIYLWWGLNLGSPVIYSDALLNNLFCSPLRKILLPTLYNYWKDSIIYIIMQEIVFLFSEFVDTWCQPTNWTGPLPVDYYSFHRGNRLDFRDTGTEDNMIVEGRVCNQLVPNVWLIV